MSVSHFEVLAPLQDFDWSGNDFDLAPGLRIRRYRNPPDLSGMHEWISKDEWKRISGAQHWLTHEWASGAVPSPGEVENLVLLSLWLVKPTRTQIAFRFEIGRNGADGAKRRQRLLDRFMWVPGAIHFEFEDTELQSASAFYSKLTVFCSARGRLNDALLLTLSGCWSHAWQVSLVCHAAAAEALLTYSTAPGITRRLATSYACLTETKGTVRDAAFREFSDLYTTRSDIMHGRIHNVLIADRLPTLVRFQNVLRKLWTTVASSPQIISILEDTDARREAFFKSLQSVYTAPP